MIIKRLANKLTGILASVREKRASSLHHRFVARVLMPPLFVLILLGIVILWQLNSFVRDQAVTELDRAATTTASKLEREFALREKVLKRTGDEIFAIKSTYLNDFKKLEQQRTDCTDHIRQKKPFQTAPDNTCQPFLATFATNGATLQSIEDGYASVGTALIKTQKSQINERLTSYGQFFPETMALLVADNQGAIVSSALNPIFEGSAEHFINQLNAAKETSVEGQIMTVQDVSLAVFAYPNNGSTVLAAYNVASDSFLRESWESTPVDRSRALTVILDSQGTPVYPRSGIEAQFESLNTHLRTKPFITLRLNDLSQIAAATEAQGSKWLVVVSSPQTYVLSPVRDAQIVAVLIIGTLLTAFLWVGTFFIQRTLQNIIRLVSGALVFSAGKLDYKIGLDSADEEFSALATTMNSMAERIDSAEKELDEKNKEFISVATHELRTPLTAIIGNLSMAVEDYNDHLDETTRPILEQAQSATIRMRNLINDMLDIARLEGGRVEFDLEPQDIEKIIQGVTDDLQIVAKDKSVTLEYNPKGASSVKADADKLHIVLNNLVSNALKYNRQGGSVKISHKRKGRKLITAIADTGLGIPENQQARMFEKFFRVVDEDRKSIVGTGLGMHITKEYITAMQGELWFESKHGKGTTFYFSLPAFTGKDAQPKSKT